MDRREFIDYLVACSSISLISGCVESEVDQSEPSSENSETATGSSTKTPFGPTPSSPTFMLEISNRYSESLTILVELSEESAESATKKGNKFLYSNEVTLDPGHSLNLKKYRNEKTLRLKISHGEDILFNRQVEVHEGYDIQLLSESEIEVNHIVS